PTAALTPPPGTRSAAATLEYARARSERHQRSQSRSRICTVTGVFRDPTAALSSALGPVCRTLPRTRRKLTEEFERFCAPALHLSQTETEGNAAAIPFRSGSWRCRFLSSTVFTPPSMHSAYSGRKSK